jgi:hypothetical protein
MSEPLTTPEAEHDHPTVRHERKDVNVRGVLLAVGMLGVTGIIVHLAGWWIFDFLLAREQARKQSEFPLAAEERGRLPPEPRLEEIDRLHAQENDVRPSDPRAEEQSRLSTYGWVDQKAGIIRIPIDEAMRIIVEEKKLPTAGQDRPRNRTRPSGANSGRTPGEEQP